MMMKTFRYPKYNLKKSICEKASLIFLQPLMFIIIFEMRSVVIYFSLVLMMFVMDALFCYCRYRWCWVAKNDTTTLYFSSIKNAILKTDIKEVSRQIIAGQKVGINIILNSDKVVSKNFSLNETQWEQLLNFLNEDE